MRASSKACTTAAAATALVHRAERVERLTGIPVQDVSLDFPEVDYWFVLAVMLLPLGAFLKERYEERARKRAWQSAAQRLGLEASGSAHSLAVSGRWRAVTVEITHAVTYQYKGAPLFHFVARARLPELGTVPDVDTTQPTLEGAVIAGWLQHEGSGQVKVDELEALLDALVRTACKIAAEPKSQ